MEEFKRLFKEITGLDYDSHTDEEYNEWYHRQYAIAAENTTYEKEILNIAERIIETKDYPQLLKILENYDMLVKEKSKWQERGDYPYWCYGFNSNGQE